VPLSRAANPHLTQCRLGRGLPPYQMVSSSIQPFGHNRHGPKIGGCAPLGGAGSPCNTIMPGPTSTSLSSGILIHPAVWPQQTRAENGGWGGVLLFKGELGPHVTQCGLGRGLPSTKWHLDPCSRLAWPQHVRQNWGCCAPLWGRAGFPSNTMSPGPRSTSVPSGILIHPAIWPQQTWTKNWGLFPFFGEGSWVPI